ncbi:TPA: hypothetical protein ACGU4A_003894 [Vibrio vulnificus]
MNKIETFNKFNCGMRRPNRQRHLELCGFKLTRIIEPYLHYEDSPKPMEMAMRHINALSETNGCFYHGVTLPKKDYEGWTYYEVWTRQI